MADIGAISLTHWHPDHAGLAGYVQELSGASVYVHERDAALVRGDADAIEHLADRYVSLFDEWSVPEEKQHEVANLWGWDRGVSAQEAAFAAHGAGTAPMIETFTDDETSPSTAIILDICALENIDPMNFPAEKDWRLHDHIDAGALDSLLQSETAEPVTVQFDINNYHVNTRNSNKMTIVNNIYGEENKQTIQRGTVQDTVEHSIFAVVLDCTRVLRYWTANHPLMNSLEVDPLNTRVLERNYDYAQKNVRLLAMWYECEIEQMLELLAEHDIALSRNDKLHFGESY